jgi:hypothetical protein
MNEPIIRPAMPASSAGSFYATAEKAKLAIELSRPTIEAARKSRKIVGSGFLYVVIMDPALRPGDCLFEKAILHEAAFGDPAGWDAAYDEFAREKARVSWQHGMDSRIVQRARPYALKRGDSLLEGGVCIDGIVVAVSGAFPWFDEAIAGTVASWLKALSHEEHAHDIKENKLRTGESSLV